MKPRVSIGLPVYNGEAFLSEAIESILAQSFRDFELIISDNASTDRTPEICRHYAAADSRIRNYRNPQNLGAAPNYNLTFGFATGEYFKWAAHDDVLAPQFLAECVAALDADPDAVLCHSLVQMIDESGERICTYDSSLRDAASSSPAERFAALILTHHFCHEFFGLIRTDALRGTPLHGTYHGSDRALLGILALRGKFLQIPEPLFLNRHHSGRYSYSIASKDRASWHDIKNPRRIVLPHWSLYGDYVTGVNRYIDDLRERFRCYGVLASWWVVDFNAVRILIDPIAAFEPRIFEAASWLKRHVFGSADEYLRPQHRKSSAK